MNKEIHYCFFALGQQRTIVMDTLGSPWFIEWLPSWSHVFNPFVPAGN